MQRRFSAGDQPTGVVEYVVTIALVAVAVVSGVLLVVCRSIDDPGSEQTEATVASCTPDFDHVIKSATDH